MCRRNKDLKNVIGLVLAAFGLGIFLFAVFPSCIVAVVLAIILIGVGILLLIN